MPRGFTNDERYAYYEGSFGLYSGHDPNGGGYTIVLKRPKMHTIVRLASYQEAMETIENHCENYDRFVAEDQALGEYLTSDRGAWGR